MVFSPPFVLSLLFSMILNGNLNFSSAYSDSRILLL
jgi:hypothetical protein